MRELWASAPDDTEHGVPHTFVQCEGGKAETASVRAALERFDEVPEDGWRWAVGALAAHVLHDLCGISLLDCRYPPSSGATDAASPSGGRKR